MKNITLSIDDDTYRLARIAAAERDTTVSAMVRDYLKQVARPALKEADAKTRLFDLLDRAAPNLAADRLSREASHARRDA